MQQNNTDIHTQHYVFGYGSLINEQSRKRCINSSKCAIPVNVKKFQRSWSYRCPRRDYTAVCVERMEDDKYSTNGVLILLTDPHNELASLDEREKNYARGMIPISDITNLSNVHLPENSIVWVYEIHTELAKNYSTTSQQWIFQKHSASPLCPIPQSYIDCILSGCMQFGTDFAKEFITTTKGWSAECWINDRKYCAGTRKYIIRKDLGEKSLCDLSVKNVDNLLANTLPTEFTHKLEI